MILQLTDGFSCEVNVFEPSQNMYSLIREHNSSFTCVFNSEFGLAFELQYQQVQRKGTSRDAVPPFPAIRPIARFLCSLCNVFTSLISKLLMN